MVARHLHGRFGRPRAPRRVVVLLLLLLALLLVSGFYVLTRPQRLAQLTGTLLADITGAQVQIASARFGVGSIQLRDVSLRVPLLPGEPGQFFRCEEVYVRHSLWSLLQGKFQAQAITFIRPVLYLTEDTRTDRYNYQFLRPERPADSGKDEWKVDRLPELFIRDGAIEFGQVEEQTFSHLGRIRLSGRLTEQSERPGTYHFSLLQQLDGRTPGTALEGSLDLRRLELHAQVHQFTLESTGATPFPRKFRRWWEQLSPEGSLPTVRFGYDPDRGAGFYAELEVRDMFLTLPYTESTGRMSVNTGRFTLGNERITITNLAGRVEGFDYIVDAQIDGLEVDAPFTLTARLNGHIEPKPRFVPWFPPKLQAQFHRFDPAGPMRANVELRRKARGEKLQYNGNVILGGVTGTYHKFPYPMVDVTGQIEFNDQRVRVVDFRGKGPHGGHVVVNGTIAPPGDTAQVDMLVKATGLIVDDMLLDAMEPKHRAVVEMFRDLEGFQRLQDRHVVQTTATRQQRLDQAQELRARIAQLQAQPNPDAAQLNTAREQLAALEPMLNLPVFDMGGIVDVVTHVHRPLGEKQPYSYTVDVTMNGVRPLMRVWPYPVRVSRGRLYIDSKQAIVKEMVLESITGQGSAEVTGTVDIEGEQNGPQSIDPHLEIQAREVPIDPVLLASLPERPAQWLNDLRLAGKLDARGRIFRDDKGITFNVDGTVKDGSLQPVGSNLLIEGVGGEVLIEFGRTTIHRMAGVRQGGNIALSGMVDLSQDEATCDLKLEGANLAIEPALLDLIPPGSALAAIARKRFEQYRPAGRFDTRVHYQRQLGSPPRTDLTLSPKQLEFDLRRQRLALRDMAGDVHLTPGSARFVGVQAGFDQSGRLTLDGEARMPENQPVELDVTFSAANTRIDPLATTLLPPAIAASLNRFRLQGQYQVSDGRLAIRQEEQGQRTNLHATVAMQDASLNIGTDIRGMKATLDVTADLPPGKQPPKLDVSLDARQMLVSDRLMGPLTLTVRSEQQDLLIDNLRGEIYGGKIVGQGRVSPTPEGRAFDLQVTLSDAALDPIVHPRRHPPHVPQAKPEHRDSGTVSAALNVGGTNEDPKSRRGRGEIVVRDARMYELPVAMVMLQLINFAPPTARGFDRASASYLIEGDKITFDTLRFEAPTIAIAGEGHMLYSSKELDLILVTQNPGIKLGPMGDLMRMFKDELISVHVTGTLAKPTARLRTFNGVRETWNRIFGTGAATKPAARAAQANK